MVVKITHTNNIMVNGVVLPDNVVRELQRLGRALDWYTHGELQSAVKACAVDANLIDDPDGINFIDKLELTDEEKYRNQQKRFNINDCEKRIEYEKERELYNEEENKGIFGSFCKRLKEMRERKKYHPEYAMYSE